MFFCVGAVEKLYSSTPQESPAFPGLLADSGRFPGPKGVGGLYIFVAVAKTITEFPLQIKALYNWQENCLATAVPLSIAEKSHMSRFIIAVALVLALSATANASPIGQEISYVSDQFDCADHSLAEEAD